jgi:hypothetical protein
MVLLLIARLTGCDICQDSQDKEDAAGDGYNRRGSKDNPLR